MPGITGDFDRAARQIVNRLQIYVDRVEADIDPEIQRQTSLLRNDIVAGWPVDTGTSRSAFQGPIPLGFAHYGITNNIVYVPVIEFGGYPGIGPKTSEQGGQTLPGGIPINRGIYPTQKPSAPIRRALFKRLFELTEGVGDVLS